MDFWIWVNLTMLFLAGGLTPGPAVMLVTSSAVRYGFWPAMASAIGVCTANLLWITLAAFGASALWHAFPDAFLALKFAGIAFIAWLAWRMAFGAPVDLLRQAPPPRRALFANGIGLQILNPNALVYFGVALPMYFDTSRGLRGQVAVSMGTVTVCELFGLSIYALGANALAQRFTSQAFATWFLRSAAVAMMVSAGFAVYATRR